MINFKTKDFKIENIENVFFDKDGTLIDLDYFWGQMTILRVKEIIKRYDLNETDYLEKLCLLLGYNLKTGKMIKDGITALYSRVKIIEIFTKNLLELNIKTNEKEITEIFDYVNKIFYQDMQKYTKPIESAIDFIKKIRNFNKNIKTAIVTSDSKQSTDLTIEHFSWQNLFDFVAGREMSSQTKESGALTILALENLKADPKKTLMIGDAPMDYLAAINAGVDNVILVSSGQIDSNDLKKTTNKVVSSLDEIEIY